MTYSLAGYVGVPNLGLELHFGGAERIVGGYDDVNLEDAAFVWGIWRTWERALEVIKLVAVRIGLDGNIAVIIGRTLVDLLLYPTKPIVCHASKTTHTT